MDENYTIQFTRNKEEAKRVYYNKDFKKAIRIQIIRSFLFLPGVAISSFFLTIALQVALELGDSNFITYTFTLLFSLIFLSPFLQPIFKVYKITRNHLNEMYKSKQHITTHCDFNILGFRYKNDFFEYASTWENVRSLKSDEIYVQLQSIMPNVLFILPRENITNELLKFIKDNIDKTK